MPFRAFRSSITPYFHKVPQRWPRWADASLAWKTLRRKASGTVSQILAGDTVPCTPHFVEVLNAKFVTAVL